VRQLKPKGFICNALNCLNEENKIKDFKFLKLRYVFMFSIQIYENVCLDTFLVRQLKHISFICNALNCLGYLFI
jgi:hypothetical protein